MPSLGAYYLTISDCDQDLQDIVILQPSSKAVGIARKTTTCLKGRAPLKNIRAMSMINWMELMEEVYLVLDPKAKILRKQLYSTLGYISLK